MCSITIVPFLLIESTSLFDVISLILKASEVTGEAVKQLQSLPSTPDHNDQGHPLGGLEGAGRNPHDYMESLKPLQFGKQQASCYQYTPILIHTCTVHVWRNVDR